jgi:acetoin:2,6-dichlorophenolindophenol oxidoreductase subunit beta
MPREMTYSEAINEALDIEMGRDETVVLFGEDVAGGLGSPGEDDAWGGSFAVTGGLLAKYPGRVLDTPISEASIVGCAAGAAVSGLKPVAEVMFSDFMTICADQLVNQAAKFRYMFGGKVNTPMVVRTTYGAGQQTAAQHSQTNYAMFAGVPGLKVAVPATPRDVKGMLIEAIQDPDPVVFFEHKLLYDEQRGEVPEGRYTIRFGEADVAREGGDVTVVAIGRMRELALAAAETLAAEGIECEVIDPRTVSPLDEDTIFDGVEGTGRLVVVDEGTPFCSVAADIVARVSANCFEFLQAPPRMVTAPHSPVPFSPELEKLYLPDAAKVAAAVRAVAAATAASAR